jgi:hypothetical protein
MLAPSRDLTALGAEFAPDQRPSNEAAIAKKMPA